MMVKSLDSCSVSIYARISVLNFLHFATIFNNKMMCRIVRVVFITIIYTNLQSFSCQVVSESSFRVVVGFIAYVFFDNFCLNACGLR